MLRAAQGWHNATVPPGRLPAPIAAGVQVSERQVREQLASLIQAGIKDGE